jgi:hypothetical protein
MPGGTTLKEAMNEVVNFDVAMNAEEFARILALLPDGVGAGVAEEVQRLGDAHRYHAEASRAYYFERRGNGVTVWSWNHVYRPHEAGELIFRVVSSPTPLDEALASECYARATGRDVTNPRPPPAATGRNG